MIFAFTIQNWKQELFNYPQEDLYSISKSGTIVVADGVTRDPFEILPSFPIIGKIRFLLNYQKPSMAKEVSQIFCKIWRSF